MSAQVKMPTSRQNGQPCLRDWSLDWPLRRASSSSWRLLDSGEEGRSSDRRGSWSFAMVSASFQLGFRPWWGGERIYDCEIDAT